MPAARRVLGACAALLVVGVGALAGCSNANTVAAKRPHSGDGTASTVDGVQQITLTSGNDLRFHPSTIVVHPGRVRVVLENTAETGPPHNFSAASIMGAFVPTTVAGQTQSATFTAPAPGRYRFVCTFHEAQGQTGTLIVERG